MNAGKRILSLIARRFLYSLINGIFDGGMRYGGQPSKANHRHRHTPAHQMRDGKMPTGNSRQSRYARRTSYRRQRTR